MRNTMTLLASAAFALLVASGVAMAASISCPNAPDGFCYGTNAGDGMYGTDFVDKMYGFHGADLMYGYDSADRMYGGDEIGWRDKIRGQRGEDLVQGNRGDDALYAGNGDDTAYGGRGDDLIQGGYGNDVLSDGYGADRVNARDGQKDLIICGPGSDLIYLDAGLDVLRDCGTSSRAEASGEASSEISSLAPPEDLFAHTGKVLVEHEGENRCVAEKEVKGHLEHGDEIINPAGCSDAEEGR